MKPQYLFQILMLVLYMLREIIMPWKLSVISTGEVLEILDVNASPEILDVNYYLKKFLSNLSDLLEVQMFHFKAHSKLCSCKVWFM